MLIYVYLGFSEVLEDILDKFDHILRVSFDQLIAFLHLRTDIVLASVIELYISMDLH
jgi:hypothetical protein